MIQQLIWWGSQILNLRSLLVHSSSRSVALISSGARAHAYTVMTECIVSLSQGIVQHPVSKSSIVIKKPWAVPNFLRTDWKRQTNRLCCSPNGNKQSCLTPHRSFALKCMWLILWIEKSVSKWSSWKKSSLMMMQYYCRTYTYVFKGFLHFQKPLYATFHDLKYSM